MVEKKENGSNDSEKNKNRKNGTIFDTSPHYDSPQILQMSRFVLAIILTLFAAVPGTLARVGISHFHAPSRELQRRHARRERSQFAGKIERSRKVRKTKKKQLAIKGPAGNEAAKIRKIVDKTPSPRYWEIEAPKERD